MARWRWMVRPPDGQLRSFSVVGQRCATVAIKTDSKPSSVACPSQRWMIRFLSVFPPWLFLCPSAMQNALV